jgi:molybdopterin/thiamine biosynthesis adenylyltransferase
VIGPIAGIVGSLQAGEAIAYVTGRGATFTDRMLTYDGLSGRWHQVRVTRDTRCPACAAIPAGMLDASQSAR